MLNTTAHRHQAVTPDTTLRGVPPAPITARQRRQLKARIPRIEALVRERGISTSAYELTLERWAAENEFEIGAWLWWAMNRPSPISVADRARVIVALIRGGRHAISYEFHTVFGAGERDMDSWFEQGDGDLVRELTLRQLANSADQAVLDCLKQWGWSLDELTPAPRASLAFTQ